MTDTTTTPITDTTPDTTTPAPTPDTTNVEEPRDKPRFTDFGVDQDLADALEERGIVHPFAIQELSLPLGVKGHDIIGQARTGTGKTLGFGLPLLQRIDPSRAQTQAMVIVPTRELCIQVADDLTVGAGRGITSIAVYGGVGYEEQIEALTGGVHVVVGTPGRTLDHLGRGNLDVSGIHTIVLDEADEMLDMGFLPDIEKLLADVPTDRQTLLFSATMPTPIVKLARRFMNKPTFMRAEETLQQTAPTVDQHFFLVHRMDKPRVLARLLQMPDRGGAFVFCRTKRMCDRLVRELEPLGVSAIAVHGDLRQSTREKNLDQFRAGEADVLVATEVAARGLDVSNVTHVVNYDCPDDEKMYLHRIGRTARAGESGVAVTFAEFNEVDRVNVIRKRVGVEDELTEVFSTSDELTTRFDLPETTPWDRLASSDSSSERSSKSTSSSGRSSRGRSRSGSSSRDDASRSKARSSGSNRSSGRGNDRDGASDRGRESTRDRGRESGRERVTDGEPSSGRSRTRTRTRRRDEGGRRDRDDQRDRDQGRPTSTDDDRTSRGRASTARDTDTSTDDQRSSTDTSRDRSSGGSGRKRARRNRRRGGGGDTRSSDAPANQSSEQSSSDRDTGTSRGRSRSGGGRSGGGRSGGERSSSDGGRSGRGRSGRGRSGAGESRTQDRSANADRSTRTRSTETTRRGSDARGEGTPRLDRRVDVEHLP